MRHVPKRPTICVLALVMLLFSASPAAAEPSLQGAFDSIFGPGAINVATDETGAQTFAPGTNENKIEVEFAGNANSNTFGWYPASDPNQLHTIFTGSDGPGAIEVVTIPEAFGVFSSTPDGLWRSQPSLNSDSFDHFLTFSLPGVPGGVVVAMEDTGGGGDHDYQDLIVSIKPLNDPPTAAPDAYTTDEDTPLTVPDPGVLSNDTDPESDPLTAALVTGPAHGTLTLNPNGSFAYTPAANFNGTDTFTYNASDGTAVSNTATVTLTVRSVNDPPAGVNDAYTTDEDTPLTVPDPGVLSNDTDPESDPLTAALVTGPAHGTLTLNPNGSFAYTPAANFNGTDTFTYNASDGTAVSNTATVTLTVRSVNDAPVAADDSYKTSVVKSLPVLSPLKVKAPGVLSNDTDVESDPLTAALVTGPAHGTLTLNPDGSLTYKPNLLFVGTDTFTYKASDGTATSNVATVKIKVSLL
ncbi:MAG: Ig-like domain-containing protein, partial [Egibacteraceae bacterium]